VRTVVVGDSGVVGVSPRGVAFRRACERLRLAAPSIRATAMHRARHSHSAVPTEAFAGLVSRLNVVVSVEPGPSNGHLRQPYGHRLAAVTRSHVVGRVTGAHGNDGESPDLESSSLSVGRSSAPAVRLIAARNAPAARGFDWAHLIRDGLPGRVVAPVSESQPWSASSFTAGRSALVVGPPRRDKRAGEGRSRRPTGARNGGAS
jgi:hypothetical protein